MRKIVVFMLTCMLVTVSASSGYSASVALDAETFPDDVFRIYLSNNFDMDGDGILSNREILNIKEVYIDSRNSERGGYVLIRASRT